MARHIFGRNLSCHEPELEGMVRILKLEETICSILQSQVKLNCLADVVRELTQNGVDAKASRIRINVKVNHEADCIDLEYSDDGMGIDPESLANVGKRFFTSKVEVNSEADDSGNGKASGLGLLAKTTTFGFRGEAMNSLRNISNTVMITSCVDENRSGFKVCFSGERLIGKVLRMDSAVPVGTRVRVVGLFDAVVVRKRLLLNRLEKGWVDDIFEIRRAVIGSLINSPWVNIEITRHEFRSSKWSKNVVLKSAIKKDDRSVPFQLQVKLLNAVFGQRLCDNFEICRVKQLHIQLTAGIGLSTVQTKKYQFIYLNGRPLINKDLSKYINSYFQSCYDIHGPHLEEYRLRLKRQKRGQSNMYGKPYSSNPILIANFSTPIDEQDLVQDPSKSCFSSKNMKIFQLLFKKAIDVYFGTRKQQKARDTQDAIRMKGNEESSITGPAPANLDSRARGSPDFEANNRPESGIGREEADWAGCGVYVDTPQRGMNQEELGSAGNDADDEEDASYDGWEPHVPFSQEELKNQSDFFKKSRELTLTRRDLKAFVVIGQVDKKFILVRHGNQIIGLDQHASHERINLERMYKELIYDCISGRFFALPDPIEIDLDEGETELLRKYRQTLFFWGIRFRAGDGAVASITHLPQVVFRKVALKTTGALLLKRGICEFLFNLQDRFKQALRLQQLDGLSTDVPFWWIRFVGHMPTLFRETIKSKACRESVMFGDHLSPEALHKILSDLYACHEPFQCAHGRPSLYPLCELQN